ncbi:PAS domain S-box protein [Chryseobacterium sp. CBSDS_008]|uniref:PAS domain S-box protein n=1 Tax=Chryseobacterium sp. CBSDS_008 TaxID=3415265 RepID=UPI003CF9E554
MEGRENLTAEEEIILLKQRVAELSDFIENASVPLHWVDSDGIIIWANQEELDLLGYTKDEYLGAPIKDFHADANTIDEILRRLSNFETIRDFPAKLRCKDGSVKYVNISSNVLSENGKFIHTRCISKDVTATVLEEKRKNKLLTLYQESEERLRLAIGATDLGIWDWDFETAQIVFSTEAQKILDLKTKKQHTKVILSHIFPADRESVNQSIKKLKNGKKDDYFEFACRFLKSDGTIAWINVQGSTFCNDKGNLRRIIGCVLDITEAKESNEKNAKLVAIVNSSNDPIIGKTISGIITSWNNAAEQTFGFQAEEMVGKPILDIIPPDHHLEENLILEKLRSGEALKNFETKRLTKDGKHLDVSLTISPIKDQHGEIIGLSTIARDISAKKEEESKKNAFVSMVSHELRTPLTSILLWAQVIQRRHINDTGSLCGPMASKIEGQANRMNNMIKDFLSLARLEEGKIEMHQQQFGVAKLFEEIKDEAQYISESHQITIVCDPSYQTFADRDKIWQVLINLISNAIKYSSTKSSIILGCEAQNARKLRFYVQDHGVGITEEDQQKLFKRFFRVESAELANISGFGIGLFIVSEILKGHNSKIEVHSKLGEGSTFQFFLNHERSNEISNYIVK